MATDTAAGWLIGALGFAALISAWTWAKAHPGIGRKERDRE